jgi:hypothetical protein
MEAVDEEGGNVKKITADEFEKRCAERQGVTIEFLRDLGQVVAPCDCGEDGCDGWIMVQQLPGVKKVEVVRFFLSPDCDQPECICSTCRKDFEVLEEEDTWGDAYDTPIRLFIHEGHGGEARFHTKCFEELFMIEAGQMKLKPGIELIWIDEDPSMFVPAGPVCNEMCTHPSCKDIYHLRQMHNATGGTIWPVDQPGTVQDLYDQDLIP